MINKNKTVYYVRKMFESNDFLETFFKARISELEKIKLEYEKDRAAYLKELQESQSGKSRFSPEYLEDFILRIDEKLKDVNDNITVNRYHLYGEAH